MEVATNQFSKQQIDQHDIKRNIFIEKYVTYY